MLPCTAPASGTSADQDWRAEASPAMLAAFVPFSGAGSTFVCTHLYIISTPCSSYCSAVTRLPERLLHTNASPPRLAASGCLSSWCRGNVWGADGVVSAIPAARFDFKSTGDPCASCKLRWDCRQACRPLAQRDWTQISLEQTDAGAREQGIHQQQSATPSMRMAQACRVNGSNAWHISTVAWGFSQDRPWVAGLPCQAHSH